MRRSGQYILYTFISLWMLIAPVTAGQVEAKEFVVVIDAGHGGRDPGAVGAISKEKDINLKVALKFGNQIKRNCKDVKVVYTRDKDVFIPLDRRAQIANNAKADLFISIHTNSVAKPKTLKGTSSWTLGLATSDSNLAVAKRENSVIMYESDYQTRYAGFNPNSSESYIIFEFMQDKYMSQSVQLASLFQQQFKSTCKRVDRGVHQAGFLVLKATAMPSVLIELGFISTPEEERYLNTEEGTTNLANGIYKAFISYKNDRQAQLEEASRNRLTNRPEGVPVPSIIPSVPEEGAGKPTANLPKSGIVFKVQILTSSVVLNKNDKRFQGLQNTSYYKEGSLYKYTYGESSDHQEIQRIRREVSGKFKDAFVVAFKNGKKMDLNKAIEESGKTK
ncbi:N-acetylmuramoyl-L-alanine amidase [Bacteroides sp. OttesenSCG-928-F21]|nr:N-acetylmuramoyl-L-alanine amidase [Bacteroides sp. OttesenSCG-928-F21]